MKYYEVKFDKDWLKNENQYPKGEISFKDIDDDEALRVVKEYLNEQLFVCYREPEGKLTQKYLVPGGGYDSLWDWDSFFMACSVGDENIEYAIGSIKSLLENVGENGRPAKNVCSTGDSNLDSTPLPLQAQFAYVMAKRIKDFSWIERYYPDLERMIEWYDKNCVRNGYYVYPNLYGNGIDNNPAVYGRGDMSSSACDFVAFMYRELKAMEKLSAMFKKDREQHYKDKAEALKKLVSEKYFDEMDKCFYCIDCNVEAENVTLQEVNWITYLKFRSWAIIFPMWAGIATREQAEHMKNMIMSENEFLSVCGVRSHSKADPVYNNVPMGNPSNWQGPVWGLSTFLTAYALARYGYKEEALDVSMRLIKTYALDILQNGCIHEYYNGDNGQPVIRPGFLSWNIMALRVVEDIKAGVDATAYDLLD